MKNFLKKAFGRLVDLLFIPIELVGKIFKNVDNVAYLCTRIILLTLLLLVALYVYFAKPYRILSKDFYFEKYSSAEDANKATIIESKKIDDNVKYLESIGADCELKSDKKGSFYDCFYTQNKIYVKYRWGVFLRFNNNKVITYKKINKQKLDGVFVEYYKKIFK